MTDPSAVPARVLPAIVLSQLAGTSPWFATNAVLPELARDWALAADAVGWSTSAVQLGFICGTLAFAVLALADRIAPRRLFLACALSCAAANAAVLLVPPRLEGLLVARFATGVALAGIYPVGMKIAASWYTRGLGTALGFLVGALVLGTALPFGLRALGAHWPWQQVIVVVSLIAAAGGATMWLLVPDGAQLPPAAPIDLRALAAVWTDPRLRASVLGYFGHMWELYAFIVMVPAIVLTHDPGTPPAAVSALSFAGIGMGAIGCALGGLWAARRGSAAVASWMLASSACCCVLGPWLLSAPTPLFVAWLLFWGATVAGDSPQFSTLNALNAPRHAVGSVLTLVNGIGFAITVIAIQWITSAAASAPLARLLPWLAVGPAIGWWAMRPLRRASAS